MRLLVVTQTVDSVNPVLGFFHNWLVELARRFEDIHVICLYEGEHVLPRNVTVYSLGKESLSQKGRIWKLFTRPIYILRFYRYIWLLRRSYDSVLVHMNQEYVLLGGPLWKFLRKQISMWRNHYAGSLLTDFAAAYCTNIFCTSRSSYTAKYTKTELMPVGVDLNRFHTGNSSRKDRSILFFSRMAPSKNPHMLLEALYEIAQKDISFTATFVGSPISSHEAYYRNLIERAEHYELVDRVNFIPEIPNSEAPDLYRVHQIFVNCSPSGMFDKVIFEAAACGSIVLALSEDYENLIGSKYNFKSVRELVAKLELILSLSNEERKIAETEMSELAKEQGLTLLIERLSRTLEASH